MSTHVTTRHPARDDVTFGGGTVRPTRSRRWSIAGIGAGLSGLGILATTTMVNGVYDQDLAGHPQAIADKIAGQTGAMFAFHSIAVVGALLLVVFGVGLFHRLRAVAADSAAPLIALAGLLGTAVVVVLGSGLDTEFMMSLSFDDSSVDVYNTALYNHWIGTIPWVWVLSGLAGLATFSVSRLGGVPRWIGRVGLVLGGLTLLLGISPLEYMAGLTGALMVLVTAVGFTFGDKQFRHQ
ncbi:hypothetical protein GCM10009798_32010 [Nocardioides panacihumi]|uniref:DUF4386 family protein n=1 Tax=Nocardioides panacihumi TaxID=400774 RepID=A0ABP5CUD3_9ACTN